MSHDQEYENTQSEVIRDLTERIIEVEDQCERLEAELLAERKKNVGNDYLLQFFRYEHLPVQLQEISKPFGELAQLMVKTLPENPERSAMLRKLLETKDCAVRALLFETSPVPR